MLKFFRNYQKHFFIFITVVIVISFSFFGTYDTLPMGSVHAETAFVAVDGRPVTRGELNWMMLFLGTDAQDKFNEGGAWGPNFLNDGVLKNDLMVTGIAEQIAGVHSQDIAQDFASRQTKEKRYTPYAHPQAKFISVVNTWNFVAPEMRNYFEVLRSADDPTADEALKARIGLYVGDKEISPALLKRVLRFQEQQYPGIAPDPRLDYVDLSLFGYHTFEDWFGSRYLSLLSQFVINGARLAEQKGYAVSKEEALADLMMNAEKSYQQLGKNGQVGVANIGEYFDEQLRRMNMDRNSAVKVWQQVLLFRRLFNDVGASVFLDPLMFKEFNAFAKQQVSGELYQLQKPLRFKEYADLQRFEIYLDAISSRETSGEELLKLPLTFKTPDEVAKVAPELVFRNYKLQLAMVNRNNVEGNIGVKQAWNWEVEDANWKTLAKEFPELGLSKASSREERFGALDALDATTRNRANAFARKQIVASNPELIHEALAQSETQDLNLALQKRGGKYPIEGLKKGGDLMPLLDQAPIGEISEELSQYSADGQHFYRIVVVERSDQPEVMSLAQAEEAGVLAEMLDRKLQAFYLETRKENPSQFQKGDGSWKDFKEVQNLVADRYFKSLLDALKSDYTQSHGDVTTIWTGQLATPYRFAPYLRQLKEAFASSPEAIEAHLVVKESQGKGDLSDQWKLVRTPYALERHQSQRYFEPERVFALSVGAWTDVATPPGGDAAFFQVTGRGADNEEGSFIAQVERAQSVVGDDAKEHFARNLLNEIIQKGAFALKPEAPDLAPAEGEIEQ